MMKLDGLKEPYRHTIFGLLAGGPLAAVLPAVPWEGMRGNSLGAQRSSLDWY